MSATISLQTRMVHYSGCYSVHYSSQSDIIWDRYVFNQIVKHLDNV